MFERTSFISGGSSARQTLKELAMLVLAVALVVWGVIRTAQETKAFLILSSPSVTQSADDGSTRISLTTYAPID
jgi:hypothetical protein